MISPQQWSMALSRFDDRQHWQCRVERPGGMSYLFFQQFTLQVSGVSLENVEVLVSAMLPAAKEPYILLIRAPAHVTHSNLNDERMLRVGRVKYPSFRIRGYVWAEKQSFGDHRNVITKFSETCEKHGLALGCRASVGLQQPNSWDKFFKDL